jgi:hypothetical protein
MWDRLADQQRGRWKSVGKSYISLISVKVAVDLTYGGSVVLTESIVKGELKCLHILIPTLHP